MDIFVEDVTSHADKNSPIPLSQIKNRTIVDHANSVQEIINNPNKSPLMGVIGQSLLHDVIEGICLMIVMSLLKQASSLRLITYGEK